MHTILVADDSVTIQRAVEIVFDKEPFTVIKASSGTEALARAKSAQPHVVLVDHTMPDTNGYDLAAALKADPSTQQIPVLFFSATANPFDEARGTAAGVVGFVQKPFDCQTLLDRVRGILGVAATAPGTFVSSTPSPSSAAAANLPRPPSMGTLASLGGLPRPPSIGGVTLPRPGPSGLAGGPSPIAVPATTPAIPATADPFGFGQAMSSPPQPASSLPPVRSPTPQPLPAQLSQTPTPAASTQGFQAGPQAGFSSPQSVAQAPAATGWQAMAPGAGLAAQSQNGGARAAVRSTDELMEITEFDVADDNSNAKATTKLDLSAVRALDAAMAARVSPLTTSAAPAQATPAPPAPAQPASLQSQAVDAVVARAAPALTAAGGAPSHEALSAEARSIVERIAWEVVPELAEVIIREEIQRLLKAKNG